MNWQVYIVKCNDNSLYTGITTDLQRRIQEHNSDNQRGARYTRGRRPVHLLYSEQCESRSHASRREAFIKQLPRASKLALTISDSVT